MARGVHLLPRFRASEGLAGRNGPEETGMMAEKQKKCAHEACSCIPKQGEKYCSQYCKDSKDFTALACDCGHPGCEASRSNLK